jgi:hypothetical protein
MNAHSLQGERGILIVPPHNDRSSDHGAYERSCWIQPFGQDLNYDIPVCNDPQRFPPLFVIFDDNEIARMPATHQVCGFEDCGSRRAARDVQNAKSVQ